MGVHILPKGEKNSGIDFTTGRSEKSKIYCRELFGKRSLLQRS